MLITTSDYMMIMPQDIWTSSFRIRLVQKRKMGTPIRLVFDVSATLKGKKDFNDLSLRYKRQKDAAGFFNSQDVVRKEGIEVHDV